MDNTSIHHGEEVEELLEHHGMFQWHTYSFDANTPLCDQVFILFANPIEEAFSKIKHYLQHHHDYYLATEGSGIFYDMWEVLEIITPADVEGYFFYAGYF